MTLQPNQVTLLCTIAMLAVTAYFFFGSLPLLILKHDNTMDARFIRTFYITYYRLAVLTATVTTVSYIVAGRPAFAIGAASIEALTLFLRRTFIPRMDALHAQIQASDAGAIAAFRRIHKTAIAINLAQVVAIVGGLSVF